MKWIESLLTFHPEGRVMSHLPIGISGLAKTAQALTGIQQHAICRVLRVAGCGIDGLRPSPREQTS